MVLKVKSQHLQVMQQEAETRFPFECCGLLLGRGTAEEKQLIEVIVTENSWNEETQTLFAEVTGSACLGKTQHDRFAIAPQTLLAVQKSARARNLEIIGVFHSHPNGVAIPSEFDRAIAWPQYAYIILAVQPGQPMDLQCWCLDETGHFQPEKILNAE